MKRILIGTLAVMMAMPVFAEDPEPGDKTTTSQPYVETQVGLKQGLIPAAGTNSATVGDTVVTYTANGGGEIGERGIYTGATDYDESTDADKLITASALNTAFTTLPETPTTTLECANTGTCTLWTIVDQTAYGVSGSGGENSGGSSGGNEQQGGDSGGGNSSIDLSALAGTNGTAACSKLLSNGNTNGTCTTAPSNYGDWGVMFDYDGESVQVSGISACSSVQPGNGQTTPRDPEGVSTDYDSNMSAAPTTSPAGRLCYCKVTDPNIPNAPWVRTKTVPTSASSCASGCARLCASDVSTAATSRSKLFGLN